MFKTKRRNIQLGGSKAVTFPAGLSVGEETTMAGNRLLILDTTGDIPEDALLDFLVEQVEPVFWEWWKVRKYREEAVGRGGIRPMEAPGPAPAKGVKPAEAAPVAPQPRTSPVICPRCNGQITWNVDLGREGYCPYCGIFLRLVSA